MLSSLSRCSKCRPPSPRCPVCLNAACIILAKRGIKTARTASRKPLPVCANLSPRILSAANTPELKGFSGGWQRCEVGRGSATPDARKGLVCGCTRADPSGLVWRRGVECGEKCPGFAPALEVYHSARCIGDEVTAVYAACGLADSTGRAVVLNARQAAWLDGVSHPGVTIRRGDGEGANCQHDFNGEVREAKKGVSRAAWYCRAVAKQLHVPTFDPVRPRVVKEPAPVIGGGYVLLAPFANSEERDWAYGRWREVTRSLVSQGKRVEVTAGHWQADRLKQMFAGMPVGLHVGKPAKFVLGLVAHAGAVVANDSGLAHVAGLHETPCVVVQGGWPAGHLHALSPSVVEVRVEGQGGLAGISAERVLAVLAKYELDGALGVRQKGLVGAGERR